MSQIKLDAEQTARIVTLLQDYFKDKLDSEIGQFDAEFLLDFFSAEVGVFYYNQALIDAQALLQGQFDNMAESMTELEKWTPTNYTSN